MLVRIARPPGRRGAIAPMTAILSAFILGMVAFAVDTSWIVLTQSELQNAADSAALAASNRLMDGCVQYYAPNQSTAEKAVILAAAKKSAAAAAREYAGYNNAGGTRTGLTLLDADIEYGQTNASGAFTPEAKLTDTFPNTVRVTLRRDAGANSPLRLFFAPVVGVKAISLTATAASTLYAGQLDSFKSTTGISTGMLPMAYDTNAWDTFLRTGRDPDGNLKTDSSGNPILQVYPSNKDTGNFGMLSLNDSHNGASTIDNWIHNGMSSSDIAALQGAGLIPLSKHDSAKWDWLGNPGFKASNVMDVNTHTGKTFLLPLFKPYQKASSDGKDDYEAGTGNGSHYNYNIVGFVGVRIVDVARDNRQVIVTPAAVMDPNAVFVPSSVVPVGSTEESKRQTTFAPPKMTK